jgi:exodeoxyribonuclease V alpha subunit
MQEITGTIERLTYYDDESHFAVAALHTPENSEVIIVGTMPAVQVGVHVRLKGDWKRHPKHGSQFEVTAFEYEVPKSPKAIEKFLASGVIPGVGPAFAAKLVKKFGPQTLEVIDKFPERLSEIEGLGEKRKNSLINSWAEQKQLQEVFVFLQEYGITRAYARRVLRTYGNHAISKIKENPYQLAKDVNGIGFKHADLIAKTLGFKQDFPKRIEAGIDFVLYELAGQGHVCYPVDEFVIKAEEILKVTQDLIRLHMGRLLQQGEVEFKKLESGTLNIWSKPLFVSENGISSEIKRLSASAASLRQVEIEKAISWSETIFRIQYAPLQKEALKQVLQEKFSIVTGGPGTGKSTITKAIVAILGKLTNKIILAAPTGRAAKRLSEITGRYASTLHRILKFDFVAGKFKHDRANPLDVDLLIIDESSMIDTYLMYQLLRALPSHAKVVVIGDANQLPSIGPGNVLRDLISSNNIPVCTLSAIYRQAKGSSIIVNAHKINQGQMPYTKNQPTSDFFFFDAKEPDDVRTTILDLATKRIPQKFGFDAKKDIQVLAPMKKGPCGIEVLNKSLQEAINPQTQSPSIFSFRLYDKVMQLRNNYNKDVFNGDIGCITALDQVEQQLTVTFEEQTAIYEFSELDELALAYAVSVHKYQGSECPCIIMPVHTVHFKLLTRNLLYTGVTRGKKLVVLVGTKKALAIAVKNQEVDTRHTGLPDAIHECFSLV